MKLALVSPYDFAYPGGVTEHVASLAEQFIANGHEVHIVAPSSDDDAEPISSVAAPIHRIGRKVIKDHVRGGVVAYDHHQIHSIAQGQMQTIRKLWQHA